MPKNQSIPQTISQKAPKVVPTSEPLTKKHFWEGTKYLAKSAFDYALGHIWEITGGAIVTAIAFYIFSGQAEWLYPFFRYTATFFGGVFSLITIIVFLTLIKLRKEKALKQTKPERFISNEKGVLDYINEFEHAETIFPLFLKVTTNKIEEITDIIESAKLEILGGANPSLSQYHASRTATKLIKYAKGMEKDITELNNAITALDHSATYLLETNGISKNRLVETLIYELFFKTQTSLDFIATYRKSQLEAKGISQDLNTALNRIIYLTEEVIGTLQQALNVLVRLIRIIRETEGNKKLNS